jgi:hypothetical protein
MHAPQAAGSGGEDVPLQWDKRLELGRPVVPEELSHVASFVAVHFEHLQLHSVEHVQPFPGAGTRLGSGYPALELVSCSKADASPSASMRS